MNYTTEEVTSRAKESALWRDLEMQDGRALPYLLERYLLLENWRYMDRLCDQRDGRNHIYDIQFLHLLMAEAVTVMLSQEERIRKLEGRS